MTRTLTFTEELVVEHCCECGVSFAMPSGFQRRRRDDHDWFYCPAGHQQHYIGETEAQKLQAKLDEANRRAARISARVDQETARADHEAARVRGYKGALAKTKRRIAKGVCPGCNRSFPDLAAHIATKHPDLDREEAAS